MYYRVIFVLVLLFINFLGVSCIGVSIKEDDSTDSLDVIRNYNKMRLMQILGPEAPQEAYNYIMMNKSVKEKICSSNVTIISKVMERYARNFHELGGFIIHWHRKESNKVVIEKCKMNVWIVNDLYEILYSSNVDSACDMLNNVPLKDVSRALSKLVLQNYSKVDSGIITFFIELKRICLSEYD